MMKQTKVGLMNTINALLRGAGSILDLCPDTNEFVLRQERMGEHWSRVGGLEKLSPLKK